MSQLMKSMFSLVGLFGFLCADTTPVLNIPFEKDGRKWKEGFQQTFSDKSIVEYVLSNENINNWSELVTVQTFSDVPENPETFYNRFMDLLKENVGANLHTNMISKDANSVLGEWWIKGSGASDQHELVRVFRAGDNLIVAHYVTKDPNEMEKHKAVWQDILKQVALNKQVYKNNGYSLTLPGDWTTLENQYQDLVKRSFEDPAHKITIQDAEIGTIGSESPWDEIKDASKDLNLWGEFDKYETLKLDNGDEIKMMVYKPRKKFRDYDTVSILAPIVKGDRFYLLAATVPANDAQARTQAETVLKSFKLDSPK